MIEVCNLDGHKAFDSVNHRLVDQKVGALGVGAKVNKWVAKCLRGRPFGVKFKRSRSDR